MFVLPLPRLFRIAVLSLSAGLLPVFGASAEPPGNSHTASTLNRPATSRTAAAGAIPATHLANISTRVVVGAGNDVAIGGFIITGTQPKTVMMRGIGPSLPVLENLADCTLQLFDSARQIVASNDNWRDSQEAAIEASQVPPKNDYESAIVAVLEPGVYTAVLSGRGATTGVGLIELYDLDRTVDSKLANISTRGLVDSGDSVLIGGTIVTGTGTTSVIFRALGPSLQGIQNRLLDPTLELYDGQGALIASNNDWEDSQKEAVEKTTIPPSDPREAALVQDLSPGAYTVIVRGKNNTTGVALVEAYQLN